MALDGKGEAELRSERNYPNLPNYIETKKYHVCRSVCTEMDAPMFSFSQKINCCVTSEQDGCSFCSVSCESYGKVENCMLDLSYAFLSK